MRILTDMDIRVDLHPYRSAHPVWAIRAVVRKISWLDGQPRWQDGRVVWQHPQRGTFVPTPADLARAQRCLVRVQRHAAAARVVVGNVREWLKQQRTRLATAALLQPLAIPDLPALIEQVPGRDPALIEHLSSLLLAEALCTNRLPISPGRMLLACGCAAYPALRQMSRNHTLPTPVIAMAALTLGALHHTDQLLDHAAADYAALTAPWLRQAFTWGQQHGQPDDPWLLLQFLATANGDGLARRFQLALTNTWRFRPTDDLLHELVVAGVAPARIVALLEALATAAPLARRILVEKSWEIHTRKRRKHTAVSAPRPLDFPLTLRQQALADLQAIVQGYVQSTANPSVIYLIHDYCRALLKLTEFCPALVEAMLLHLRNGLDLPARLQQPYLALLVAHHQQRGVADQHLTTRSAAARDAWLRNSWEDHIQPIWMVLYKTGDRTIVDTAIELGIINVLANQQLIPDRCRLALEVVRCLGIKHSHDVHLLFRVTNSFATSSEARATLRPLLTAITQAPVVFQVTLLLQLLHAVEEYGHAMPDMLRRLQPYLVRLVQYSHIRSLTSDAIWRAVVVAMLALVSNQPVPEVTWFEAVLDSLRDLPECRLHDRFIIALGVRLSVILADGDLQYFATLFSGTIRHDLPQSSEHLEAGIKLLERFPGVYIPLRALWRQQPHRCALLLARLGLAAHIGLAALDPLRDLETDPAAFLAHHALPTDWQIILDVAPDLLLLAATYLAARQLCGDSLALPAGVRKALEQPRKLLHEAQHLEQLVASQPGRADLSARLVSLRTRLCDQRHLRQQAHHEARARLRQVTAEAQLAAAEEQLLACFRERLKEVVGRHLPVDLPLDDNLLNAILLSVTIDANRRLLRELLRAHLRGEYDWRERQPANVAFLNQLATQGVDLEIWLSDFTHIYACPGVAGGRVWLALERDPLHVLQMGNYFNTCLSMGGWNAFATVANACDVNKRVLYVRDATGRVVGRTLIAINAAGELVGFHRYCLLNDPSDTRHLQNLMQQYLIEFAAQCGLPLGTDGPVPLLCAQDWYDDGIRLWNEKEGNICSIAKILRD